MSPTDPVRDFPCAVNGQPQGSAAYRVGDSVETRRSRNPFLANNFRKASHGQTCVKPRSVADPCQHCSIPKPNRRSLHVLQLEWRESFARTMERNVQRIQEPAGTGKSRVDQPPRSDEAGPADGRRNARCQNRAEFPRLGRHLGRRKLPFRKQRLRHLRQSDHPSVDDGAADSDSELPTRAAPGRISHRSAATATFPSRRPPFTRSVSRWPTSACRPICRCRECGPTTE